MSIRVCPVIRCVASNTSPCFCEHPFGAEARRPSINVQKAPSTFADNLSPSHHVSPYLPHSIPAMLLFGWVSRADQAVFCLRACGLCPRPRKLIPWAFLNHSNHFPRVLSESYFLKQAPPSKIFCILESFLVPLQHLSELYIFSFLAY